MWWVGWIGSNIIKMFFKRVNRANLKSAAMIELSPSLEHEIAPLMKEMKFKTSIFYLLNEKFGNTKSLGKDVTS